MMRYLPSLVLLAFVGGSPACGQQPAGKGARTDLYGDPLPAGALARLGTIRFRDPHQVHTLTFSPDGKFLVTAHSFHPHYRGMSWGQEGEGGIRFWDPATGKEIRRIPAYLQGLLTVAFSSDGKLVALVGLNGIRIVDPATGREISRLSGIALGNGAAFSPGGKAAAIPSPKGVRLFHLQNGKEIRQIDLPRESPTNLAFSPDGTTLMAACGSPRTELGLYQWEVASGRELRKLDPRAAGRKLTYAPDGKAFVTAMLNQPIHLWDAATAKELRSLKGPRLVYSIRFSRDGKRLLAGGSDGAVLLDVGTGEPIRRFAEGRLCHDAALAPDERSLAVIDDSAVRLFDVKSGKELFGPAAHISPVETVGFSPDGQTAFTGADGLAVWDPATGKRLAAPGPRSTVGAAAFARDGKAILAGYTKDEELHLWEASTGKELRRFEGKPGQVEFVGFLGDGKSAVSMSQHGSPKPGALKAELSLRVWDLATGKETRRIGNGMMHCAAASADGRRLAAGMHELRVWDVLTGQELAQLSKRPDRPLALVLTPDGRRLAQASFMGKRPVRRWEILTGREMESIPSHDAATLALAVSPDGRILATGGSQGTIGLWDFASGKELRKLKGHTGMVLALAFSADGRRLISGSRDTTALIWDVADVLPKAPATRLDAAELKELWATLGSPDGAAALRAVRRLADAPEQALPFLRAHLDKPPAVDRDRLARLLADLDADNFARREKASAELARLGPFAEPGLKRLLENNPPAEVRRRVEALLKKLDTRQASPAVLQAVRALEVLEQIATPEARQLIAALAEGSAEARVREEARAALARLANGPQRGRLNR